MTTIAALLHLPVLAEPPHQPVHLRTTQTRHLDQVPQQQPAHGFRLFLVLLRSQRPFYPAVNLFPVQRPKANFLAGRQKPLDLLDCERLGSLHCHLHRPAVSPLAPTPPFSGLQHHLALEPPALLSIILYWKRLYRGRNVGEAEITFLREFIAAHPELSRCALSRQVCEAWQWKQANGALREMVCRGLMLAFERAGTFSFHQSASKSVII